MSLQSPAKTIAHARACGERRWLPIGAARTAIIAVKTFEELKLRNDIMFITVPQHRRLACSKCGCRNVKVTPILPAGRARPRLSGVSYQNHNDYWQRYSAITDES